MADNEGAAEATDNNKAAQPEADPKKPTMDVKVYAPFHIYYEGKAYSLNASNAVGPFDVLPHHHSFICMLVPCTVSIDTPDKGVKKVKVHRALMHVKADSVSVFVDV